MKGGILNEKDSEKRAQETGQKHRLPHPGGIGRRTAFGAIPPPPGACKRRETHRIGPVLSGGQQAHHPARRTD